MLKLAAMALSLLFVGWTSFPAQAKPAICVMQCGMAKPACLDKCYGPRVGNQRGCRLECGCRIICRHSRKP